MKKAKLLEEEFGLLEKEYNNNNKQKETKMSLGNKIRANAFLVNGKSKNKKKICLKKKKIKQIHQ
jgi:hypothetical protein